MTDQDDMVNGLSGKTKIGLNELKTSPLYRSLIRNIVTCICNWIKYWEKVVETGSDIFAQRVYCRQKRAREAEDAFPQ